MSRWWIGACGLFVVSVGLSACSLQGIETGETDASPNYAGNANTATDTNTPASTEPTRDDNTTTSTPTTTPTPSPSPTCPTPANANDYFGLPRCCHTGAKLCEDFESGTVGSNPNSMLWSIAKANADTVEISTAQAARGNQSLHIHAANSGGQHAMITNTSAFPFANNMFWGRAFVYFNSPYPSNHTTYMAAGPDPNPNYQWLRYSSFGNGTLGGNDSDPDNSAGSNRTLARAAWSCIEWQYDPANQKAYYYLNGTLIATLNIDAKHNGTDDMHFQQMEIGWELYQQDNAGGAAWDMYFDEIALDSKRIGCSN